MYKRLIVGCGKFHQKQEGDITLDIKPFDGVDIVHDLNVDFPFENDSVESIIALHIVEHLDDLIHFMDECWRILIPGGELYIETPLAGANTELEFADPTHKRCYTSYTFHNYFTLSGIQNFGYTEKPWAIINCGTKSAQPSLYTKHDILIFHGYPLKKDIWLNTETLELQSEQGE